MKVNNILVSIVIPVYNVQDYIAECLSSVATQAYTEGIECLIVDDCGTDNSIALTEDFLNSYRGEIHFRIIRHEHNKGLSAARNTGIMNAFGKYVLFVDSDDTIAADCIKCFHDALKLYPDAEMIVAGAKIQKKKFEKNFTMEKSFPDYADNPQWITRTILRRGGKNGIPVTAWNRLVRRDFLIKHKLFFAEGLLHEDELWNFMLATKIDKIAFCKHNTYNYRIRPHSIMTSFKTADDNAKSCMPVWNKMIAQFSSEWKDVQTMSLWNFINDYYPSCKVRTTQHEIKKILWQLVAKGIWPTSLFIFLYLMPFIFHIKFIRKLVAKMSRINVSDCQPILPSFPKSL